jgi:hypothetical protein
MAAECMHRTRAKKAYDSKSLLRRRRLSTHLPLRQNGFEQRTAPSGFIFPRLW